MSKTAQQVIADLTGDEAAARIIASLERHGYRIIRHRVVNDEDVAHGLDFGRPSAAKDKP